MTQTTQTTQTTKPPLGIMPRHIHDENRLSQLQLALKRYEECGWPVRQEWLMEIRELERRVLNKKLAPDVQISQDGMRGLEILHRFQDLTPWQREQAVQYFLGTASMHENGFTDGHENSEKAKYALDEFVEAIHYAHGKFPSKPQAEINTESFLKP